MRLLFGKAVGIGNGLERTAGRDHIVDDSPIGQTTKVAVVDKEIDLELARIVVVARLLLFGIVAVDSIELYAVCTAVIYSFLQQVAFANAPKNQFMTVGLEATKGVERKGTFGSNTGVTVRHNGTVEIYGNEQNKLKVKS